MIGSSARLKCVVKRDGALRARCTREGKYVMEDGGKNGQEARGNLDGVGGDSMCAPRSRRGRRRRGSRKW
jgi:hypothetical protein